MEKRVTSVLVLARVVNSTELPVVLSVTARRPDASPAMSPMVRFGPTRVAPPPRTPSSASYMSYGMLAPRPTKNGASLVLFCCFTGSSLASAASTTRTVYLPLAAVHVPRETGAVVAPAAMTPVYEPVRVRTTVPAALRTVSVMPCAPPADATVPWFLTATEKFTTLPLAGVVGVQLTGETTRSE